MAQVLFKKGISKSRHRNVYARLERNSLQSVNNPTSIHGIYPYRGKISALDAQSTIDQLDKGRTMLDPFCGSGTIIYEGALRGLNVFGVDNNPLAIWVAEGKLAAGKITASKINSEIESIVKKAKKTRKLKKSHDKLLGMAFHSKTAGEVLSVAEYFEEMSAYIRSVFLGAVALTARGCNHYKWTSSTVGKDIRPKRYINFYDKFLQKAMKHLDRTDRLGGGVHARLFLGDSRRLSKYIKKSSIDYVFTSPPYFDALDYTAYYAKIIYNIINVDRMGIREGLIQKLANYESDMKLVLNEIMDVTTDDALIIFVVGDKKIRNTLIHGGEFFSSLLQHKPNMVIEREYTNSSSQIFDKLNKTKRKEQLVIWDKSTW